MLQTAVQVHFLMTYMSTRGYSLLVKYYIATEKFAMNFILFENGVCECSTRVLMVTSTFLSLLAHPHLAIE